MPPDISHNHNRLEKVLKGLEQESLAQESLHKRNDSNSSTESFKDAIVTSPAEVQDREDSIKFGPLTYVDSRAFGNLIKTRIAFFGSVQVLHLYALYSLFFGSSSLSPTVIKTWIFSWILYSWGGLGVTAGSHRLWSHKSYQAKWPLRVFLMIGHSLAGQNSLFTWSRDHRVHHKFSETDADPHNSNRGFFFSHVGWLLTQSHPEYKDQVKIVYAADLLKDPVVYFQHKYFPFLSLLLGLFMPIFVPIYFWGEGWWTTFLLAVVLRYATNCHCTWFVNSAAHMFGDRPYNVRIQPRENPWVSFGALGEGYHNYHHSFPWDYATSELGMTLNPTKRFIDFMSLIGQAYNCKVYRLHAKQ